MNKSQLNRRDFLRLSTVAATGAIVAACAPATPQVVQVEKQVPVEKVVEKEVKPTEKVVVTIFVGMGTGTAPEQQAVQNALADEWNAKHDDIKMEYMYVPNPESRQKWSAMLAAGTPPAVNMPSGVEQVGRFQDTNLDIGPYLERDHYDLSDFPPLIPEVSTYQGVTYGIPVGVYPSVLYYNEKLLDDAGVDYPPHQWETAGWNVDALLEKAKKLSLDSSGKNASEAGFDPNNQAQWGLDKSCASLNGYALSWGAQDLGWSEDFHKLYFNQKAWVDCLQWISDAIWKHYVMPSAAQRQAASTDFNTGKLALYDCHSWVLSGMIDLPFPWNVAALPAGPTGVVKAQIDVDAFLICNRFANLDAAWEVVKWLIEPDQMLKLNMTWGALPSRISLQGRFKEAMAKDYPKLDVQVYFDSINYMDIPNHESYFPRWGEVWDALSAAIDKVFTGQEKNAQVVLDELQKVVQGYMDEYWAQQKKSS